MRYIEGEDRYQKTFFPESLDDYITENNPVRFIDAFIENLDLRDLGFVHSETKDTGRKPYNPGDILKLYIYGYLNRVRTSRSLEKLTHQNIEVIWLMRKLKPDFKTIADFRRDNGKAIKQVLKKFTILCRQLGVLGSEIIAVDGSKFKAQNSEQRNYSKNQLEYMLKKAEDKVNEYLEQLKSNDLQEPEVTRMSAEELESKIKLIKERTKQYKEHLLEMEQSGDKQISISDPDSRKMRTRNGKQISYNVQIAVDEKNKLIIANDVTNEGNDLNQLHNMALQTQESLSDKKFDLVADKGYYNLEDIKKCQDLGIDCYIAKPDYRSRRKGMFSSEEFIYDESKDCYTCPAGNELEYRTTVFSDKKWFDFYKSKACKTCSLKHKCTTSKDGRRIARWIHQDILDKLDKNAEYKKHLINKRKAIVEHPFGTLKRSMGYDYFLCKGLKNVKTEFSLTVLAYNIKRLLNIIDFRKLMSNISINHINLLIKKYSTCI